MTKKLGLMAALAISAAVSGCYTTKIYSGGTAVARSNTHEEKWHHTVVAGIAEISEPVDLEAACALGNAPSWATIDEEYTFLNGLVGAATFGIYTPRTYTVSCGSGSGGASGWAPGATSGWNSGAPPAGAAPQQ